MVQGLTSLHNDVSRAPQKRDLKFRLQVDGGINLKTAHLAVAAGADVLVAGSAVFNSSGSVAENLKKLRETLESSTPLPRRTSARRKQKASRA